MYHKPVLLNKSIDGLITDPEGTYVDVTFGGGGHSSEILKRLTKGQLFAFDQDSEASRSVPDDSRFTLIIQNFRFLKNYLKFHQIEKVDGILADLGVSSYQIDTEERGFSTRFNGPVDLRMDKSSALSGSEILNSYSFEQLRTILGEFGEVTHPGRIAARIVEARSERPIRMMEELKDVLKPFAVRGKENKFYAQIMQALRIEVNAELEVLRELILSSVDVLKPKGRLVVISYHSLEDRLVKNYMKSGNFDGVMNKDFYGNIMRPFNMITRKAIVADEVELIDNPRSRSARLRIAEKAV